MAAAIRISTRIKMERFIWAVKALARMETHYPARTIGYINVMNLNVHVSRTCPYMCTRETTHPSTISHC